MPGTVAYNTVILLGPTAVGKTAVGVRLAAHYGWDVISADSRQVYEGLDIGSGKDLSEYDVTVSGPDGTVRSVRVAHHLIDVATLSREYNVFSFQQDFYRLFDAMRASGRMPFIVGGTGMYIDSVVRGYPFIPVPRNEALRAELSVLTQEELSQRLLALKKEVHNRTDLLDRERTVRAIEIALYMQGAEASGLLSENRRKVSPFIIGTTLERGVLRERIKARLYERMEQGLVEEVRGLHDSGWSWERLEKLGLEYRFVSGYLEGKISSEKEMTELLFHAIAQFAKRQETWFRGMEKKGVPIHWLPLDVDTEVRYRAAVRLIEQFVRPGA